MTFREALSKTAKNPGPICATYVKGYIWQKRFMDNFLRWQNSIGRDYSKRFTLLFEGGSHYVMRYVYGDHKLWGRAKMRVIIAKKGGDETDWLILVNGGHWKAGSNKVMREWVRLADHHGGIDACRRVMDVVYPDWRDGACPKKAWFPKHQAYQILEAHKLGEAADSPVHAEWAMLARKLTGRELNLAKLLLKMVLPSERLEQIPPNFFTFKKDVMKDILSDAIRVILLSKGLALHKALGYNKQSDLFDQGES